MKPRKATTQEIQRIKNTFNAIAQEKPELSAKAMNGAIYHRLRIEDGRSTRDKFGIERHHVRYVLRSLLKYKQ